MKIIFSLVTYLLLLGCSSEQIYNGIRSNRLNECEKAPKSERERCLEQLEDSYDDYERKRAE